MPYADISSDFRSDAGQSRFPRLKLQAGEKARVVVLSRVLTEYVHRIEAPNIVNMAPTYKKIKGEDGQDRFVIETRWISSPICFGTYEVLRDRGVDDKSCQACNLARERPDIFRPPQPKYAVNVVRYGLRPGGGWNDIAAPYGVTTLVWSFGGKVMDKLIDIRQMGPAYEDIRGVDLLLECSQDGYKFQKPYSNGEFLPVSPAFWLSTEQIKQYTIAYFQQNAASEEDLTAAIGRRVKPDWLADDLSRAIQRWDVVRAYEARQGGAPAVSPGFGAETLGQGMAHLQQQYGQQPPVTAYGTQPGHAPQYGQPGTGFGAPPAAGMDPGMAHQPPAPASGVDMGLLGGASLAQAAAPEMAQVQQMQAAALLGAGVPADLLAGNLGTAPPPAPLGTAPPAPPMGVNGASVVPTVPSSAPTAAMSAPPVTPPGVMPTAAASPSSQPAPGMDFAALANVAPVAAASAAPAGLAGLEAMMANRQQAPETPAPAAAPAPEAGGSYTFADLERLGRQ